ncbi:MAG: sulfurtransferase TusA family protein [Permianibacter sp.]
MNEKFQIHRQLDARGLRCPLPLLRAKQALAALAIGEVLEVLATDAGAARDIPAWCQLAGQQLVEQSTAVDGHAELRFVIRRQR